MRGRRTSDAAEQSACRPSLRFDATTVAAAQLPNADPGCRCPNTVTAKWTRAKCEALAR